MSHIRVIWYCIAFKKFDIQISTKVSIQEHNILFIYYYKIESFSNVKSIFDCKIFLHNECKSLFKKLLKQPSRTSIIQNICIQTPIDGNQRPGDASCQETSCRSSQESSQDSSGIVVISLGTNGSQCGQGDSDAARIGIAADGEGGDGGGARTQGAVTSTQDLAQISAIIQNYFLLLHAPI